MMKQTVLAVALIIVGSVLASLVQTDHGRVDVQDIRFKGEAGNTLSGLLYRPLEATPDSPAPAVLAVHGYINSRETQSGFAIEFARRGFVVLALDQTGHGFSDPPAFAHGFGGPAGLSYLKGLPYVDPDRIGLEGHSMGGWTVQMAAAAMPDDYQAMVLEGSSTGTLGAPEGSATAPRNLLLVFSLYDEFSELMWGSPVPADIVFTQKLKTLFGTDDVVVPDQRYGDAAAGTARELSMPPVTHPGDHLSRVAIAAAIDWMTEMLDQDTTMSSMEQVWYWKELGTLLSLVGFALIILPVFKLVLRSPLGERVCAGSPETVALSRTGRTVAIFLTAALPILGFFPLQTIANVVVPATSVLPQQITNGVLLWALVCGACSVAFLIFQLRASDTRLSDLGMPRDLKVVMASLLVAVICVTGLYAIVALVDALWLVDFRFWVVALKPMNLTHVGMFLIYAPLFALFFVALSLTLHAHDKAAPAAKTALLLCTGYVVLLVAQYLPLLLGGTLLISSQPLLTIVAFQFVPLMALVAVISTVCFRMTNNIYPGAFLNALLITWYMVAGTATQAVPFFN